MANQFIGYIHFETARAFLFQDHFWHSPDWMPKSQVTIRRTDETAEVSVEASNWISEQKGLKEFEERTDAS